MQKPSRLRNCYSRAQCYTDSHQETIARWLMKSDDLRNVRLWSQSNWLKRGILNYINLFDFSVHVCMEISDKTKFNEAISIVLCTCAYHVGLHKPILQSNLTHLQSDTSATGGYKKSYDPVVWIDGRLMAIWLTDIMNILCLGNY